MSADQKTLNHQLVKAAAAGDIHTIETLLGQADPKDQQSEALWQAIECNHIQCVKVLAPVSEVVHKHLFTAVDTNDWEIFSALIDYIDFEKHPQALNQCLVRAARFGYHKILERLMDVANPAYQESLAFRWAVAGNHQHCIDLLYPVSDVRHILEYFRKDIERSNGAFNPIEKWYAPLKERFDADQLKQNLINNITPSTLHSLRKI